MTSFKEVFSEQIESIETGSEDSGYRSIRIFAHDESRFELMPITRRRITLEGIKPVCPFQIKYESYYLYGSLEPLTGESFFFEMPRLDSNCFQVYIDELSCNFTSDLIVLLLDNSSAHKAKSLGIPDNIKLLYIPPYSPELNPVERLWQYIKSHLTFSLIEDLETLKQEEVLDRCTSHIIASLTGYSYILLMPSMHSQLKEMLLYGICEEGLV